MPKLLYTWEFGDDMGHISVFLPIANEMKSLGWEINLATPIINRNAKNIEKIISNNGFKHINSPGSYGLTDSSTVADHAELLGSLSPFWDSGTLLFVLQSWLAIFEDIGPDIIIGDFSPTALLAAKIKNIPHLAIDLGFFYPDPDQELPDLNGILTAILDPAQSQHLDDTRDTNTKTKTIDIINNALRELNVEPLDSIKDIYQADEILLFNYPELSPLKHSNPKKFLGAVISENRGASFNWPLASVTKPKIFAYLKADMPDVKAVIDALHENTNYNAMVYLAGGHEKIPDRYNSNHLTISLQSLDMQTVIAEADLIICHAGVGMITQSLLAGIPLLLLPTQSEQVLNATRVQELGAGLWLGYHKKIIVEDVQQSIEKILSNVSFRVMARAFRARHKPADIKATAEKIINIHAHNANTKNLETKKIGPTLLRRPRSVCFSDLDVVFLSFDEPNAEKNWDLLKQQVPHAKRVQGVKGFDSAHKAAAEIAKTDRFILVDADNIVNAEFFDLTVEIPSHLEHSVWQWSSHNEPTGLIYPYGGVKVWTRDAARRMRTHENCGDKTSSLITDFSNLPYIHISYPSFSKNYTNGSPYQAFRSGFREVIKICEWAGVRKPEDMEKYANTSLLRRISIWMSCGADAANGLWSMLGARTALLRLFETDFDKSLVISYDWFAHDWSNIFAQIANPEEIAKTNNGKKLEHFSNENLAQKIQEIGNEVRRLVKKPPILDMTQEQSFSFKQAMSGKYKKDAPIFGLFRTLDNL